MTAVSNSLKDENRRALAWVVAANSVGFVVVLVTNSWVFDDIILKAKNAWALIPASGALIVSRILSGMVSADWKARIVFFKWNNPLPGSHAFSRLGPRDSRINMTTISEKLGSLPSDPEEENQAWYGLYKEVADSPVIRDAHKEYLFTRDYTCMSSLFLATMIPVAYWQVSDWRTAAFYAIVLVIQYYTVRLAAVNTGRRLVTNVMAAHS